MEPPVPIPNTEVKHLSADDTKGGTPWENMSLPEVPKNLAESGSFRHIVHKILQVF